MSKEPGVLEQILRIRADFLNAYRKPDTVVLGAMQQAAVRRECWLPDDQSLEGGKLFGMTIRLDECVDFLALEGDANS